VPISKHRVVGAESSGVAGVQESEVGIEGSYIVRPDNPPAPYHGSCPNISLPVFAPLTSELLNSMQTPDPINRTINSPQCKKTTQSKLGGRSCHFHAGFATAAPYGAAGAEMTLSKFPWQKRVLMHLANQSSPTPPSRKYIHEEKHHVKLESLHSCAWSPVSPRVAQSRPKPIKVGIHPYRAPWPSQRRRERHRADDHRRKFNKSAA